MTTNFKIIDNYALEIDGKLIDLHNNFDFVSFDYSLKESQLNLFCRKSSGVWVNKDEVEEIVLVHNNVINLVIENESGNCEDSITEITFFQNDEVRDSHELTLREKPNGNDDIIYILEGGKVIRISCSEILLKINRN